MALNSVVVGLGVLASHVRTYFTKIQNTEIDDHSLPYYLANVHFTVNPVVTMSHIMYSKNILGQIEVDEGKSTLLECQATADSNRLNFQFQWLKNGKVISSKTEGYIGTSSPTLCISCATIDMDGSEYSCRVTPIADGARYILTRPVILRVNCVLDKYTGAFTALYLSKPEVPKEGWPPVGRNKFVNLALIKQKKTNFGTEYARLTIRGDIDDILQQKEEIQYNEMLQSLKSGQCLFIEGRPGCGKTTFVHKISQDWAATSFHGTIRLVLLVSLRVLNNVCKPKTAISDILELFDSPALSEEVLYAREGNGVCFILDGFDEFSPLDGNKSIVHRLINKECLKQSIVIVVSRPSATAKIRDKADKVVEVVGFKNNQIFEYFDAYPFTCSPDIQGMETHKHCDTCLICRKTKSLKLKSYLSQHPNILHMCYLPIHTFMVACLFEATGKVPHTETEMYTHFTKFLVMRHLSKSPEVDLDEVDVYNMNGIEGRYFDQICKLALEKTILNKQVLHEDEVRSYFKSEKHRDVSLGLITIDCTADQLYRFRNVYTFLHLSFQEYLAAYHISTLPYHEQMKLIQVHGDKTHMSIVWKFYCGLVEIKYNESKFKSILQRTESTLFHVQCAYESQQRLACAQLLKKLCYHIELENRYLSTPDFTAIGYVTNTSVLPLRLSITDCSINLEAIDALLCEMQDRTKRALHALNYCFEAIHDTEVQCLVKLLTSFDSLKVLYIESRKKIALPYYTSVQVQYKFTDITEMLVYNTDIRWIHLLHNLPKFTKLETVSLVNCIDTSDGAKLLASGLGKWSKNLKVLNISNNNINENGAMILADGMKNCRKLERINISNNNITLFGVIVILESLKFCSLRVKSSEIINQKNNIMINNGELFCSLETYCTNLHSLDTPLTSINSIETQYFSIYSKMWEKLKELCIVPYPWYQMHITTVISSCLQNFKSLQVLALKYSIFDVDSAVSLGSHLKLCSDLRVLDLSDNMIDSAAVERIATGLLNCGNLQELNLDCNKLSCSGAKILSLHLPNCHKLTVLSLENNGIGVDGAKALVNSCIQLQVLNISGNQVGDKLSQFNPKLKIRS